MNLAFFKGKDLILSSLPYADSIWVWVPDLEAYIYSPNISDILTVLDYDNGVVQSASIVRMRNLYDLGAFVGVWVGHNGYGPVELVIEHKEKKSSPIDTVFIALNNLKHKPEKASIFSDSTSSTYAEQLNDINVLLRKRNKTMLDYNMHDVLAHLSKIRPIEFMSALRYIDLEAVRKYIFERTDGNPFLMSMSALDFMECKALNIREHKGYHVVEAVEVAELVEQAIKPKRKKAVKK